MKWAKWLMMRSKIPTIKRREANGEDEFAFILPRTGVELLGDTPDREKYKRY
jgi:hypothetical protein